MILDTATASHFHHPWCDDVAERHFDAKYRDDWRNGAYFWIAGAADAAGFATPCANCGGRPPGHDG